MDECFEKLPKEYYKVERRAGGGGARATTHKVKFTSGDGYELALVSDTMTAEELGKRFEEMRGANDDLKERSLAFKSYLKEASDRHRFSFVVIDDSTKRVFAAATKFSAPLSFGHSKDGTLVLFCGAGGTAVATHWPLNEREVRQCAEQGAAARRRSLDVRERPDGGTNGEGRRRSVDRRSVDRGRRSVDRGRRSVDRGRRSADGGRRDENAVFTSEVGWVDPGATVPVDFNHDDKIVLTHLPVGRFVYGHAYLQPYEFTSFWNSAESNRAGMPERAFHSGNDYTKDSPSDSRRSSMDVTAGDAAPRRTSVDERRHKWETTNSKCDRETTWKKKEPEPSNPGHLPPRSPLKGSSEPIEASLQTLTVDSKNTKTTKVGKLGAKIKRNLSLERLKDAFGMSKKK